jgi:division protein CdvB (Snf7/Vps24/ESCRT-III family)|tara:strand:+ start:294 stop:482 length:189 start_codon:yes stop_codon:yes gene_type:complete
MVDEKEKYKKALKEIAELKEQLSYANERMKNAISEKDKMAEKLEEYASQMKSMKMKLDDKED